MSCFLVQPDLPGYACIRCFWHNTYPPGTRYQKNYPGSVPGGYPRVPGDLGLRNFLFQRKKNRLISAYPLLQHPGTRVPGYRVHGGFWLSFIEIRANNTSSRDFDVPRVPAVPGYPCTWAMWGLEMENPIVKW
eukprot:2670611-Rhodomonas_salina.1